MHDAATDPAPVFVCPVLYELIEPTGSAVLVSGGLHYDTRDPYAVSLSFAPGVGPRWTFARDLLVEGMHEPAGDGDVHVWPCLNDRAEAVVLIDLSSPYGSVLLQLTTREVQEFVRHTVVLVAPGDEHAWLDMDAVVRALLPT